jgi:hypothetical protein
MVFSFMQWKVRNVNSDNDWDQALSLLTSVYAGEGFTQESYAEQLRESRCVRGKRPIRRRGVLPGIAPCLAGESRKQSRAPAPKSCTLWTIPGVMSHVIRDSDLCCRLSSLKGCPTTSTGIS